jgi:hypothetical protein
VAPYNAGLILWSFVSQSIYLCGLGSKQEASEQIESFPATAEAFFFMVFTFTPFLQSR